MKQKFFIIILMVLVGTFVSCASTHNAIENNLRSGMSKYSVRRMLGPPYKIERSQGYDLWIYKFSWKKREYTRTVFFNAGHTVKLGRLTPYPDYEKRISQAQSFKEYEINARLRHRQKEAGFRTINSVNNKKTSTKNRRKSLSQKRKSRRRKK